MYTRLLKGREIEYAKELWDYCFEKKNDPFFSFYFNNYVQTENIIGAFDKKNFTGMTHLNPYTLCLNGRELPVSYLVGVATAPQYRGQGVMRTLLNDAFTLLRKRGQSVSLLMPIMAGIYLPHGFAYCYNKLKYYLPLNELSSAVSVAQSCEMHHADEKQLQIFVNLYLKYTKNFNGFLIRAQKEWQNILKDILTTRDNSVGHAILAKRNGEYCGYLLYIIDGNDFRIVELVSCDVSVKNTFLQYAAGHSSQCSHLHWLAPENDLTYLDFYLNRYQLVLQPFMMGRIIDVVGALRDLQFSAPKGLQIDFCLQDDLVKENNGVFQLAEQSGKAYLVKNQKQKAQMTMNIGTFAQLCFGAFSAVDLFTAGKIHTDNDKHVITLSKVFKRKNNYINEYF